MSVVSPEEDAKRRELYAQGLNDREIGDRVGVLRATIARWRQSRGLPPNTPQCNPHPKTEQIRYLIWQGIPDAKIIEKLGLRPIDRGLVIHHRLRLGLPGVRNRRWSDQEKAIACRLYAEGYTGPQIGRAMHRSKGGVYAMLSKVGLKERFRLAKQVRWSDCEAYLANLDEDEPTTNAGR